MLPLMAVSGMEDNVAAQLWQACAGTTIRMPQVNTKVCYFVQGHIEHVRGNVDLESFESIPHMVLCRVEEIKYLVDHESDEVYAKMRLAPINSDESDHNEDDMAVSRMDSEENKVDAMIKILTMSDANNGTGFSVPKQCALALFPPLGSVPSQNIYPRDVHGKVWKITHIYRGIPPRHLLTSGWSDFVTAKRLIMDDIIFFLKTETGKLHVGIKRVKANPSDEWHPESFYARCCRERGRKPCRSLSRFTEKVTADSVIQAAKHAVNGQSFEVIYYPRNDAAEFVVNAALVYSALQVRWLPGTRFRILHEKKDSLETTWFNGTISAVKVSNPSKWPESPWKLLQVDWDEPFWRNDVKHVNPWLVEPVPPDSSQPAKKIKPQQSSPVSMEGARHTRSDINLNTPSTMPCVVSVGVSTPGPAGASGNTLHSPNKLGKTNRSFVSDDVSVVMMPEKLSDGEVEKSSEDGRVEHSSAEVCNCSDQEVVPRSEETNESGNSRQAQDEPEVADVFSVPFAQTIATEQQMTEGNAEAGAASPAQNSNDSSVAISNKSENHAHSSRPAMNRMRRLKRSLEESRKS